MARTKRQADPSSWKLVAEKKCKQGKVQVIRVPFMRGKDQYLARIVSVNGNIIHTGRGYDNAYGAWKGVKATKKILSQIKF